jgi:transmembrane sensor
MSQGGGDSLTRSSDEALGWIARLRSDHCSEKDHQAFALWLAEDNLNRQTMDEALELWDDLGCVRHLSFEETNKEAANQPFWWAAALAACLVLAVFLWPMLPGESTALEFKTAIGEQLTTELSDGSQLQLNTNSYVQVTYSDDQRQLELMRGEVFFQVAKDANRPFAVNTGSASVTALGTAFNIYRQGDTATVVVTEGVVRVTEQGVTGNRIADSEVLHVNQRITASPAGLEDAGIAEPHTALAWQRGELVAQAMRLPEIIRELQRYQDIQVLLGDAELAALTVSGVFQLDQPQSLLQALAVSLDLELTQIDENTVQLIRPPQ